MDKRKAALPKQGRGETALAAETTQLAEDLPNRAAIRSVVGSTVEIEHLADLLV